MEKTRTIKFIVTAARWFDRANGNTYHSCRIERVRDGKMLYCPMQYGYGNQFAETAFKAMVAAKWIRSADLNSYQIHNNYPIYYAVSDGLKRDCIANGQA